MYGGDEGGERGEKRRAVSFEGDRNRVLGTVSLGRRLAFFCVVSFFGEEGISTIIRSKPEELHDQGPAFRLHSGHLERGYECNYELLQTYGPVESSV